jgi:uncharacterized membrane protein YkoI
MKRRTTIFIVAGAAVVAAATVGTVVAAGTFDDENQQPITGDALAKASAAALAYTGQGRVTETEIHDEESYYQVEVTLDNGKQVDVQLDQNFHVVKGQPDSENEPGDSAGDD